MKNIRLLIQAFGAMLLLGACNLGGSKPLPTVWKVDVPSYMGKWYNVARLPASFQDGCTKSTATYKLLPDSTVSVVNRCIKDGKVNEVKGSARVVNTKTNAVLEVTFNEWFSVFIPKAPKGNYF
ncbi:MAG: outer rane lipoprotein Blc, partial [Verrucomicrobiaceae bacterium]|nr:outer rane lipoprotein Blc [Verrucomicrobiaceae bacterium]